MPLQLGGIETDRPQIIAYDPAIAAEVQEALARRTRLVKQGYLLKKEEPGEIHLDPPPKGPHIGVFRILSQNGDERLVWDRRDAKQVREAFTKFKELLKKGYTAFTVLANGARGHKLTEFDPGLQEILMTAKEVLMVPPTIPG